MNEILWTRRALRDIEKIHRYFALRNPAAARGIVATIGVATQRLADYPLIGRLGRREGTRELIVTTTPFIIVYRVQADIVQIVRVLHGAQKYP